MQQQSGIGERRTSVTSQFMTSAFKSSVDTSTSPRLRSHSSLLITLSLGIFLLWPATR